MIEFVLAQYGVGMGVRLNLNVTGASALDPFAPDLPFPCSLFLVRLKSPTSVARATECLASEIDLLPHLG